MQNNELKMNYLKPNCFEKTKEAWGIFSFFYSTNFETKNVCPIAYNVLQIGNRFNVANVLLVAVAV